MPSNCLANDPRAVAGGAVCGDGIVSDGDDGDEECDDGQAGSDLCHGASASAPCTRKAGVQCASGACCDVGTGRFKPQGALCRSAMHQCDLSDYCSGLWEQRACMCRRLSIAGRRPQPTPGG